MKHIKLLALTLFSVLIFSSCGFSGKTNPLTDLETSMGKGEDYRVRVGDTLNVHVWGEPKVSGEVLVREDGNFTLPLVNDVTAEGLTLFALSKNISALLEEFIPSANVTVSVLQSAPTKYYLSGSFNKPGEYHSADSITFLQAIATGGGFAPFANKRSVILIRKTAKGEVRYELKYDDVIGGSQPNPLIKNGDIIAVQ